MFYDFTVQNSDANQKPMHSTVVLKSFYSCLHFLKKPSETKFVKTVAVL